jgi:hypothetical protein
VRDESFHICWRFWSAYPHDNEVMKSSDGRFEYQDKDGEPLPDGSTTDHVGRLAFRCRSNPQSQCSVNVANAGYNIPKRNWKLTGTIDAPTLTPSINCHGCWHGFIEKGIYLNTNKKPEADQDLRVPASERKKKFLCVCQKGCNRSVFLAYRFKRMGHSAIPIGWLTESPETVSLLCSWADHIVVLEAAFKDKIPPEFHDKVLEIDVGPDKWGPRWHAELRRLVYNGIEQLQAQGII